MGRRAYQERDGELGGRPSGELGCLTYIFTGNVGNCPMLPVWRAIGRFLRII
jgi:hypothetical protein